MINKTVGLGGDYANFNAAWAFMALYGPLDDDFIFTQISDVTETAFAHGDVNLNGFSITMTVDNWHHGDPTIGFKIFIGASVTLSNMRCYNGLFNWEKSYFVKTGFNPFDQYPILDAHVNQVYAGTTYIIFQNNLIKGALGSSNDIGLSLASFALAGTSTDSWNIIVTNIKIWNCTIGMSYYINGTDYFFIEVENCNVFGCGTSFANTNTPTNPCIIKNVAFSKQVVGGMANQDLYGTGTNYEFVNCADSDGTLPNDTNNLHNIASLAYLATTDDDPEFLSISRSSPLFGVGTNDILTDSGIDTNPRPDNLSLVSIGANEPLPQLVDFTSNLTDGIPPYAVQFTDLTIGASSWVWDFGDDSTSLDQNPVHIYNKSGLFDVSMSADGTALLKPDYVLSTDIYFNQTRMSNPLTAEVSLYPISKFSYIANERTVNFNNTSVGALTYDWNFGDGSHSSSFEPTHTFDDDGLKSVTLNSINRGLVNSFARDIDIVSSSTVLVSEYKGEDSPDDAIGGNTAEWYGETYGSGFGGRCFEYDPMNAYDLDIPHIPAYDFSSSQKFKICFYFKNPELSPGNEVLMQLFGPGGLSLVIDNDYYAEHRSLLKWGLLDGEQYYSNITINNNTWYLIEATLDNGVLGLYVDGVLQTPDFIQDFGTWTDDGADFYFSLTGSSNPISLDDIKIYTGGTGLEFQPSKPNFDYVITDKQIDCTGNSLFPVIAWDWDWGDGSLHSTTANPSHTYAAYGSHTIILTVTGLPGTSSSTTTITFWHKQVGVSFSNPDGGSNVDNVSSSVHLARNNDDYGFYNALTELGYTEFSSPANTEWSIIITDSNPIKDPTAMAYYNWDRALKETGSRLTYDITVGFMYMHIISEDRYFEFDFTAWTTVYFGYPSPPNNGFAYTRYEYTLS